MPQVTYAQLLALRGEANAKLYAFEQATQWCLESSDSNRKELTATLPKFLADGATANPDLATFITNVLPFCNASIFSQEIRFETHDFSDKSDWDSQTHGDPVAYLAGAVMKHPIDGSWLDATGAAMIAAYGGYPDATHEGDPNYLFGAYAHRITAKYDDVNYKWMAADGTTRLAWLDTSGSKPYPWKNDAGTVVVHYNGTDWIRDDTSAVVTTSLWRILPYPGYKIQINKVKTTIDTGATFTGTLHYQMYMDLAAGQAEPGYPSGNYQVADWKYATLVGLIASSDGDPFVLPDALTGHATKTMIINFDYLTATKAPVIDSLINMHLDILLSDNSPVTNSVGAGATFVAMKTASF